MNRIKQFIQSEDGASAVEYGLLVALIAVAIIGAVTALRNSINTKFGEAATAIEKGGGGNTK